jgi:cell division protease FtsH
LVVFGHLSTGAADDLRRVTDVARSMVTRYGMSERLGSVAYDRDPRTFLTGPNLPPPPRQEEYAEETAAAIDEEIRSIVHGAMDRALDILHQRRDLLERAASRLLEKETLDEKELAELVGPPAGAPIGVAAE